MSRIQPVDPSTAEGKTRDTLKAVNAHLGVTPNLFRVAARAPAVLEALWGLNGALARTTISPRARESIALAVAELNGCDYCLSAHSVLGAGAGLTEEEITRARDAASSDPKTAALLSLAKTVIQERGQVEDAAFAAALRAGVTEAEVLEVVAVSVLNVFTNYLNHVARTEIDFPVVRSRAGR